MAEPSNAGCNQEGTAVARRHNDPGSHQSVNRYPQSGQTGHVATGHRNTQFSKTAIPR